MPHRYPPAPARARSFSDFGGFVPALLHCHHSSTTGNERMVILEEFSERMRISPTSRIFNAGSVVLHRLLPREDIAILHPDGRTFIVSTVLTRFYPAQFHLSPT
jgi:hypothetical protein